MLSSHLRQQVIPKSVLFKGMKPWQIRRFILSSTVLDFSAGQAVFCRGDESNELYLVMSGAVEVVVPGGKGGTEDLVVDQFGAGEVFGDVAVLVNQSRLTNAIAIVPTSLLVVHRDALQNTTFLHPIIAGRLFLNLATDVSRAGWYSWSDCAKMSCRRSAPQEKIKNKMAVHNNPGTCCRSELVREGHARSPDRE